MTQPRAANKGFFDGCSVCLWTVFVTGAGSPKLFRGLLQMKTKVELENRDRHWDHCTLSQLFVSHL